MLKNVKSIAENFIVCEEQQHQNWKPDLSNLKVHAHYTIAPKELIVLVYFSSKHRYLFIHLNLLFSIGIIRPFN